MERFPARTHNVEGGPVHAVGEAAPADVVLLSQVLARAFQHDPVHRWLLPAEAEWRRGSAALWAGLLRRALRHGLVLTTRGLTGAALWMPPHPTHEGAVESVVFSARMLVALRRRAGRGLRIAHALEAHFPPQPHWYLAVLGTAPEHQGKGVSTALMQPILARCDADGVPAYLESSNPANVPLYERRGFTVAGEIVLPDGPTLWPMLRAPRPQASAVLSPKPGESR